MRNSLKLFVVMCFVGMCWTMNAAEGHHRDGYRFRDGKVVLFSGGKESFVTAEVRLKNGARLLPDGFIVFTDGRRERFRDDRWLSLEGEYVVVEETPVVDFDGYWVEGGRVYVMRDRRPTLVTVEVSLNDGARIGPDGVLILRDGTRSRLTEGQRVSREGKIVERRETNRTTTTTQEKPIDTSRKIEENAANRQVEQKTTTTTERRDDVKTRQPDQKVEQKVESKVEQKVPAVDRREENRTRVEEKHEEKREEKKVEEKK